MRLKVRHATSYAYSRPARSAIQMLRMTPRSSDSQFIKRWRVEIDADARLDRGEDAFGNITHTLFVEGPIEQLNVLIEGEVDTADTSGVMRGTVERLPLSLYLRATSLTCPTADLRQFARTIWASEGGDRLAALHRLTERLHTHMEFLPDTTTTSTKAAEAFAKRAGVCQDFSHVFVACARALGVPARYVGGYFLRSDTVEQEAGHAWAEAHIPSLGWVGFDPAQGMCVTDRHVRISVGLDYLDAAPVRGVQTGGEGEALSVAVRVEQGRSVVQE